MTDFFNYLSDNLFLTGLFALLLLFIVLNETRIRRLSGVKLSPQNMVLLMNQHPHVIVDIRDRSAYDSGHIVNAQHIPMNKLLSDPEQSLQKYREKTIILVCDKGMMSPTVSKRLHKHGFKSVYILSGGMQAWISDSFPVQKS